VRERGKLVSDTANRREHVRSRFGPRGGRDGELLRLEIDTERGGADSERDCERATITRLLDHCFLEFFLFLASSTHLQSLLELVQLYHF
jgi:hypothetical protein